jgi:hypothetical protein
MIPLNSFAIALALCARPKISLDRHKLCSPHVDEKQKIWFWLIRNDDEHYPFRKLVSPTFFLRPVSTLPLL